MASRWERLRGGNGSARPSPCAAAVRSLTRQIMLAFRASACQRRQKPTFTEGRRKQTGCRGSTASLGSRRRVQATRNVERAWLPPGERLTFSLPALPNPPPFLRLFHIHFQWHKKTCRFTCQRQANGGQTEGQTASFDVNERLVLIIWLSLFS